MCFAAPIPFAAPEPFSFSRPDEWLKWIRRFEQFHVASDLAKTDDKTQVNLLIYAMGDKADYILTSFRLSADDSEKYASVCDKFDSHFVRRRNTIYERAKFNQRVQQQGKPADSFIMDLYAIVENCSYVGLQDEIIHDRIVVGIRERGLCEKMQLQPDLDLDKAVTQVLQAEAVKKQQPLLRTGGDSKGEVAGGVIAKGTSKNTSPLEGTRRPQEGDREELQQVRRETLPGPALSYQRCHLQEMQEEGTLSSHMQVSNGGWG